MSDLAESGAAVSIATFRPGLRQAVLVVTAIDVSAVTDRFQAQLQNQLCVVDSRWTKEELHSIRDYAHRRWDEWKIETIGNSTSNHGPCGRGVAPAHLLEKFDDSVLGRLLT